MSSQDYNPRRLALTLLLVLWLGAQPLIIALSPVWGYVVPHEHVTRGALSERAWQEHLREHLLGAGAVYGWNCTTRDMSGTERVVASVPAPGAAISYAALLVARLAETPTIPAFVSPSAICSSKTFTAFEMFYTPPEPPPNL